MKGGDGCVEVADQQKKSVAINCMWASVVFKVIIFKSVAVGCCWDYGGITTMTKQQGLNDESKAIVYLHSLCVKQAMLAAGIYRIIK